MPFGQDVFIVLCVSSWIHFAKILLRVFTSMFIGLWFSFYLFRFLWCLCLVLLLGKCWYPRLSWEVFSPLQFSGRVWVELVLFLPQMFCRTHQWNLSVLEVFLCRRILNYKLIFKIGLELFMLPIFPQESFDSIILGICPFHLSC